MPGVVYAPEADLRRYIDGGALTHETMDQAFSASFAQHAERTALSGSEGSLSYGQLQEMSDRLAGAFIHMGFAPLDRVIFQIGNCNELVIGFIACLKAGLIPICTLAASAGSRSGESNSSQPAISAA